LFPWGPPTAFALNPRLETQRVKKVSQFQKWEALKNWFNGGKTHHRKVHDPRVNRHHYHVKRDGDVRNRGDGPGGRVR